MSYRAFFAELLHLISCFYRLTPVSLIYVHKEREETYKEEPIFGDLWYVGVLFSLLVITTINETKEMCKIAYLAPQPC